MPRRRRLVVLFGFLAFAVLCLGPLLSGYYGEWFSGFSGIPGIEDELTANAEQELDRYGLDGATVSASGRDLTVTTAAAIPGAAQTDVRNIDGVGSVTFLNTDGAPAEADPTPATTDLADGTDSGDGEEAAAAEPTPEPTPLPGGGSIDFEYDGTSVTVRGEAQTDEGRDAVVRAARRLVGDGNVTDEMTVSGGSGSDLEAVSTTAAIIRRLGEWYTTSEVDLDGDSLTVSGTAKSEDDAQRAQQVIEQLTQRVGLTATVDSVVVTETPEPAADSTDDTDAAPVDDATSAVIDALDLSGVTFELGTAALTADAQLVLDDVASRLVELPGVPVQVKGFTDNLGDPDVNLLLSDDRAQAVRDYLISKGVEPTRLTARGFGASQPIADNSTSEGQAANRRVELAVAQGDN